MDTSTDTKTYAIKESDYLLVFCPVASRVGTDVSEALENLPGGKPAILVVMHHTFNPDQVLAESRRLVNNPNVKLTVDCLFYEDKLLTSNRNYTAWIDISVLVAEFINYFKMKLDSNHQLQISGQSFLSLSSSLSFELRVIDVGNINLIIPIISVCCNGSSCQ
uniref:Uncharacterized protein n=1 Tax=Dicentrarchus labrax TaxID=13489 RepID=A0A8C4NNH4_DICLA